MTFASSKQLRFLELRSRYPEFVYEAYTLREESDRYVIHWDFRMGPDLRFQPRLEIPFGKSINTRPSPDVLKPLVFQLGMIELISYWKAACPPRIRVEPHTLGPEAIRFWKDLYYLGLGEFRYLNGITTSFEEFLDIESKGSLIAIDDFSIDTGKYLVPIGGGKDSALSLDLLQEAGRDVVPFMVNPLPAAVRTLSAAGLDPSQSVVFKRMLDPLLLKLNGHGFLNGHTPFSALLAFSTLLASSLVGTGRIALSNESSANEATVPGT
ncbi:MAG: hypothetical protein IH599_04810, partial [Bacteroidales bacterium]|nr:hypothetical protein [Bacteroidales bacterium]